MFATSEPHILAPGRQEVWRGESTLHGNGCHDQPSVMEYENVFCECIGFSRAPGGTPQSQMNGWKKQPSIEKIKKQSCAPVTFKRYFSLSLRDALSNHLYGTIQGTNIYEDMCESVKVNHTGVKQIENRVCPHLTAKAFTSIWQLCRIKKCSITHTCISLISLMGICWDQEEMGWKLSNQRQRMWASFMSRTFVSV